MLRVEADGPILRLTLARPEVRNALNEELIGRLREAIESVKDFTRVVVISGEGSAFCAGGDLEWMRRGASASEEENYRDALEVARLFNAAERCPAVVICRVNGHCFGGGCGILAGADIGILSTDSKFAFSEVKLGLIPATIGPVVIRKIGTGHARALFTTGEVFDAEKAVRIGLGHEIVEPDQLDQAVSAKIKNILGSAPGAIAAAKEMLRGSVLSLEESARLLASVRSGPEAREGIDAFLHKRAASYVVGA